MRVHNTNIAAVCFNGQSNLILAVDLWFCALLCDACLCAYCTISWRGDKPIYCHAGTEHEAVIQLWSGAADLCAPSEAVHGAYCFAMIVHEFNCTLRCCHERLASARRHCGTVGRWYTLPPRN